MGDPFVYSHGCRPQLSHWPQRADWRSLTPPTTRAVAVVYTDPGGDQGPAPAVGIIPDPAAVPQRLLHGRSGPPRAYE